MNKIRNRITDYFNSKAGTTSIKKKSKIILDDLPILICHFRPDSKICYVNKTYCNYFNTSKKELIGTSFLNLIPIDEKETIWNKILSLNIENQTLSHEHLVNNTNQEIIWHKWTNRVLLNEQGEIISYLSIGEDITKAKIAEQKIKKQNELLKTANVIAEENELKLKELNSTKDKFFSVIAHDLRSPYNALLGLTNILKENHKEYDDSEREEMIDIINTSINTTYNLLENLLNWSRSQFGAINHNPSDILVKPILDEVITGISYLANNKNIQIINNIYEEVIFADNNMITSILRNLISNAIKFTHKNGKVIVSSQVQANNKFLEISVMDNGIGISEENIGRLFSLDQSISTSGTENETGTGLGLILCKDFIEKHNGEIWIDSTLEKGSTFYFTIPLKIMN